MILGQVSYLDIIVFLIFLAPQLVIQVGLFSTVACVVKTLPFLCKQNLVKEDQFSVIRFSDKTAVIKLPIGFIYERFFVLHEFRTPFVQQATLFEDFAVRCVRYAFAEIPARIGRVFFSKPVALPFLRFRMLRHGYIRSPIRWHEISEV